MVLVEQADVAETSNATPSVSSRSPPLPGRLACALKVLFVLESLHELTMRLFAVYVCPLLAHPGALSSSSSPPTRAARCQLGVWEQWLTSCLQHQQTAAGSCWLSRVPASQSRVRSAAAFVTVEVASRVHSNKPGSQLPCARVCTTSTTAMCVSPLIVPTIFFICILAVLLHKPRQQAGSIAAPPACVGHSKVQPGSSIHISRDPCGRVWHPQQWRRPGGLQAQG